MEGLYTTEHSGKEIIVIDYSKVGQEQEFALMKHSLTFISKYETHSALVLEILKSVHLNAEILDFFPEYFEQIHSHVSRWASVGFGRMVWKEMIDANLIPKEAGRNRNINWFETEEEAMHFLVTR